MNRLPAVLQKEIWEYVHGDRAFWKTQYEIVLDFMEDLFDRADDMAVFNDKNNAMPWRISHSRLVHRKRDLLSGSRLRKFRRYLSRFNEPIYADLPEERSLHRHVWFVFASWNYDIYHK